MATMALSPSKSSALTVKPSPSKRQKMEEDEDVDQVLIKEEIKLELPEDRDEFSEETENDDGKAIRRKAPMSMRVGDIFHMATLGPDHRPGRKDFGQGSSAFPRETDANVISRRYKQIEYGKATPEYKQYSEAIPRDDRLPNHPRTPNMNRKYSRRAWDGLIRLWRCNLHLWNADPEEAEAAKILRGGRRNPNESFSSTGESTSTSSSVFGEGDGCFFSEAEDTDPNQTVLEVKVKGEEEKVAPSALANRSWYEETLEFEEDYLDLHAPETDEHEFKLTV